MAGNSATTWGWPAKLLHWAGVAAILVLLGHGAWMTHFAERAGRVPQYALHAAVGYDFLALLVLRTLWRWMNAVPALPAGLKAWEVTAAKASHIGLYLLMFAASVTGWGMAGTFDPPLAGDLLGIQLPQIVATTARDVHEFFEISHLSLSYVLAALVAVHIAGALRHHFIKRNDVLRRMWFG